MRMRHTRTLPTLLGIALLVAVPVTAVAQTAKPKRVRHVPYHMLLIDGADAHQTDAALANAIRGAQRSTAPGGMRAQQTQYVPYYGQSKVRYDKFDWYIYRTDHFEIFFYPALEPHLQRIASYAESAYQHISGELQHDLADRVPLVVFKTESEFQENNISPETPEGVLAFAEPERNRMVLPIDEPNDWLYSLITHELTHIFEFNIIPRGLVNEGLPLWVDEGLAEFMTGDWIPGDRMEVRDAALTDNVPKMSRLYSAPLGGRTPYALGHATFEFIESRWGKDGLRTFLFALRKSVLGGGETAYEEALKLKPADFDDEFDRYLKERFKPFRDKQRPADYGRNIAPDPERSSFSSVISLAPSPSGDLLAGRGRQPQRSGTGRDPDLGARRAVHPQPHEWTGQGPGIRADRPARRTSELLRPLDRVGAGRRPAGVLRSHRKVQVAHRAERGVGPDGKTLRARGSRRSGVTGVQSRRPQSGVRRDDRWPQ